MLVRFIRPDPIRTTCPNPAKHFQLTLVHGSLCHITKSNRENLAARVLRVSSQRLSGAPVRWSHAQNRLSSITSPRTDRTRPQAASLGGLTSRNGFHPLPPSRVGSRNFPLTAP
jgi:hypothetical protein